MENELMEKQGWRGLSAVLRAERSSDPAEITAGMEEGDWGGETCLYQSSVSNFTDIQVFNRLWSQAHRDRLWVQGAAAGLWGSRVSQHLRGCSLPGSWFLALQLQYPQLAASSWAAARPERVVLPWAWFYFFSLDYAGIERGQCPSLALSQVCWGLPLLVTGSVIPQGQADLYTRYTEDKLGAHQLRRPDVIVFL